MEMESTLRFQIVLVEGHIFRRHLRSRDSCGKNSKLISYLSNKNGFALFYISLDGQDG